MYKNGHTHNNNSAAVVIVRATNFEHEALVKANLRALIITFGYNVVKEVNLFISV